MNYVIDNDIIWKKKRKNRKLKPNAQKKDLVQKKYIYNY